ncbi:C-type lectin lectoxin-Thr1-like [Sceloporus undulatus]|uniref:C-type lectin lectoxin-Thr1-like n=1 Tax=Sceloporus undulatus TaxID=8520 RepID=UPI001C4B635A|nr:C-type lectin lectoxin-Thr1-like [Sceloporus undulatus]
MVQMGSDSRSHFSPFQFLVITFLLQVRDVVSCPVGWISHKSTCFGLFKKPMMNWYDAETACQVKFQESHLASLLNEDEMRAVSSFIKMNHKTVGHIWIGLQDIGWESVRNWQWKDMSPVSYIPWAPGQPSNRPKRGNCAELYSKDYMQWSDDDCDLKHAYLCRFSRF